MSTGYTPGTDFTDLIARLEASRAPDGSLHFDPRQTTRLISFIKTTALSLRQQDATLKLFKRELLAMHDECSALKKQKEVECRKRP